MASSSVKINGVAATGANVTASSTVTITLVDSVGVGNWVVELISTDSSGPTVTLSTNQSTKTVTFTAPADPCALQFRSTTQTNGGSLTSTFCCYVVTAQLGLRKVASGETTEGSSYGTVAQLNTAIQVQDDAYADLANATEAATANTICLRDASARVAVAQLNTTAIATGTIGATATQGSQGQAFTLAPQIPHANDLGVWNSGHFVAKCGFAASSNSYQAGTWTWHYGDSRKGFAEGEYIGCEMGFLGLAGFDTSSGVERTPSYFKITTATNSSTGKKIAITMDGNRFLNLTSSSGFIQLNPAAGKPMSMAMADYNGGGTGYIETVVGKGSTSGAGSLVILDGYTLNESLVTNSKLAYVKGVAMSHVAGGTRETFRFHFQWLGGTTGTQANIFNLADDGTTGGILTAISGRVAVTDLGGGSNGGKIKVTVTGTSGTANWTVFLQVYSPSTSLS